jgi:hypothetical protein
VKNSERALEFATSAKSVIMRPHVNAVADDKTLIMTMAAEINELKNKLVRPFIQVAESAPT